MGVDHGGVVCFVNHQTELLFGYDRDDLVGKSVETLVLESSWQVHPKHRAGYFADPKNRPMGTGMQLTGRRRDGTEFPADIRLSSVDTEDGLMVIAAVRDVTERNNAHQNLQQMAAVIRNSDAAIIDTTLDGIVTSSNPAAERMLGYSS